MIEKSGNENISFQKTTKKEKQYQHEIKINDASSQEDST